MTSTSNISIKQMTSRNTCWTTLLKIFTAFLLSQVVHGFWSDSLRRTAACLSWAVYRNPHGSSIDNLFSTTNCQHYIGNWDPAVELPPTCTELNTVSGDRFLICRPNNGNIVYVVTKGSDDADWNDPIYGNTIVSPIPFTKLNGGAFFGGSNSVHQGFGNAWTASRDGVFTAMHNACSTGGCQVVLTGHSRGGSIAGLAFFNLILEPVQKSGQYDFSYIYQNPSANLRVITFGEGFATDFEAIVSTSDYTRIAALQNSLKERWVSCSSSCIACDEVTWVGFLTVLNDFGKIVKSCNGAYGHSMTDHYMYSLFVKNEVDRLNIHCVKAEDNSGGQIFRYENCGLFGCRRCGDDTTCTSYWDTALSNTCPAPELPPLNPQVSSVIPPPQSSVVAPIPSSKIVSPSKSNPSKTPPPATTESVPLTENSASTISMLGMLALSIILL